jgi:hypothetical protein
MVMNVEENSSQPLGRSDTEDDEIPQCDSRSIPEDGETHLRQSASSACFWSGSGFAEGIMADGHAYRINRSNTWPHRPGAAERQINPCQREPSTHAASATPSGNRRP